MKVVGITGGIGSGKTIVCDIFRELGVPVYEADAEAKRLYDLPEVMEKVKEKFGEDFFQDGAVDRKKLAGKIFKDPEALKTINSILHPQVKKHFNNWKKQFAGKPYVLKEAAILFESGTDKGCDKIITVTAPEAIRIQRVTARDKRSQKEVEEIMNRQWPDEEKIKRSDFVIVNDGESLILPEVLRIHGELLKVD